MKDGLQAFNFPLNGRLITKLDGTLLPGGHFQALENFRYTDAGIESVSGMTNVCQTKFPGKIIANGFFFKKERPAYEHHSFIQVTDPVAKTSAIYKSDSIGVVPAVTFTFAASATVVASADCSSQVAVGQSIFNSTDDDAEHAVIIDEISESGLIITLESAYGGTAGTNKQGSLVYNIPAPATYSLFLTLDNDNVCYFSEAPDQSMVFCNGVKNYVWSGNEYRCASLINFDPDGAFSHDFTAQANNNMSDDENVIIFKKAPSGILGSTKGLYHFDNNLNDSSGNNHNMTVIGTASYKPAVFGNGFEFTGANGARISRHVDFDMSGGNFTLSLWAYVFGDVFYWGTDTDNYMKLSVGYALSGQRVTFVVYEGGNKVVDLSGIVDGAFLHIEVVENEDSWYLFAGESGTAMLLDSDHDNHTRLQYYTGNLIFGYNGSTTEGIIDEVRISNIAVHTVPFVIPLQSFSVDRAAHVYVGSTRPISGIKPYVKKGNTLPGSVIGFYWSGTAWVSVGATTDGTIGANGYTLEKTGLVTFASTVGLSSARVIDENIAYFYYFIFEGISDDTSLSQLTLQCPVQELVDIWDGIPRQVYSCIHFSNNKYADYTSNIYALDYGEASPDTYLSINSLSSGKVFFGFNERCTAMKIYMAPPNYQNNNTSAMTLDIWDGSDWSPVTGLNDGTSVDGKTLNRTGVISWDAPPDGVEYTLSVANSAKWFYYRMGVTKALDSSVRIDHVAGFPVQTKISPFRYPVLWQNRLWLLNDMSSASYSALGSSYGTVCVFNGVDSGYLIFGGPKGLTVGATLFTRFGGSLYENMIVCKENETYLVDGYSFTGSNPFVVYQVSGTRGCIAPLTLSACDTGYEVAEGVTKHVLVWLSNSGVVMFDSNSVIEISSDIDDVAYLNLDKRHAKEAAGFYVSGRGEYHILLPKDGLLAEEWVYDAIRKRWYKINRGDKKLSCGFNVESDFGIQYCYGGTHDGCVELLEHGTTFDGEPIEYKFRLPDDLLNNSWADRKEIRSIRLVAKCKTNTTAPVEISHYADGCYNSSIPVVVDMKNNKQDRRFYKFQRSVSFRGTTHSLEFSTTTDNEHGGFDPLYVSGLFKVIDLDLEDV